MVLPPQEQITSVSSVIVVNAAKEGAPVGRFLRVLGQRTKPAMMAVVQGQARFSIHGERKALVVGAVVCTLAVKTAGVCAATLAVAGMEQVAPVGAPVHVKEAVPLKPAPPIISEYVAFAPAATVAAGEPPGAIPKPSPAPAPVPDKVTVCGLPDALSAIVSTPVRAPVTVGVKVTLIWQLVAGDRYPQRFDSLKSPVVLMREMARAALPVLVKVTT